MLPLGEKIKKVLDLIWEKAILFYGRKAVLTSERDTLDEQIDKLKELSKVSDTAAKRYRKQADKKLWQQD